MRFASAILAIAWTSLIGSTKITNAAKVQVSVTANQHPSQGQLVELRRLDLSKDCSDKCTCANTEHAPVCGSDGITYINSCFLECVACRTETEITVASEGECPTGEWRLDPGNQSKECSECDFPCPWNYDPVCGSDGKTYSNMCRLECAMKCNPDLTMASKGECPTAIKCGKECLCTKEYDPVCGSDGKTYGNRCYLGCEACETETEITVAGEGECPKGCHDKCMCPKVCDPVPVCGSDGKTYCSLCLLECEACETETEITKASEGECPTDCDDECSCPKVYAPVCGSDGKTHSNWCVMKCEACETETEITVASEGECPRDYCHLEPYRPSNHSTMPQQPCPAVMIERFTFDGKEGMCKSFGIACSSGTPTANIFLTLEECQEVGKCLATSTTNSSSTLEECEEAIKNCKKKTGANP